MDHVLSKDGLCQVPAKRAFVLGKFSLGHLGDTLCTSPLPRLMRLHRRVEEVYVADSPNARAVFGCNPYVSGFVPYREVGQVEHNQKGDGHVIQRLQRGFDVPVDCIPRPEMYLDESEWNWAVVQRRAWASSKPICILSCNGITHRADLQKVDWANVGRVLRRDYTVVHPTFGEPALPDAIVYTGLPTRRYLGLIAVADLFLGGNSGGAHAAAAFNVPSLIVIRRRILRGLRFPMPQRRAEGRFLYPQHCYLAAEDIRVKSFNENAMEIALRILQPNPIPNTRAGRRTTLDTASRERLNASTAPKARTRMTVSPDRRLIAVPINLSSRL